MDKGLRNQISKRLKTGFFIGSDEGFIGVGGMRWNYYYNYGKHNNRSGFKIISCGADLLDQSMLSIHAPPKTTIYKF
ncbi:hypothetical protein E5E09_06520 [Helicobacter pylori]|nr:hypothetical protein E5E09_06520 [Helicobacter pylori]